MTAQPNSNAGEKKIVKAWCVVWTKKAKIPYGAGDEIISMEPKEEITYDIGKGRGRPKMRYAEPAALFPSKKEAEAFRGGNTDWVSVPCTIIYSL